MTANAKNIEALKQIAPKLSKLSHSCGEAQAMFVAFLERARSRDITDLKMWFWKLTTQGVPVHAPNVEMFGNLEKAKLGIYAGSDNKGFPIFKFILQYEQYIAFFKNLAMTGAGAFLEGSGDAPPRFKWKHNIRHVALAAQQPDKVDNVIKLSNRRRQVKATRLPLPDKFPSVTAATVFTPLVPVGLPKDGMIALFTQKDGESMRLVFPKTFCKEEANRLAAFVLSLA